MAGIGEINQYQQALKLVDQGQNDQAIKMMLDYIKFNPEDTEALNDIGALYYCMGNNAQAIEYLEQAWKKSRNSGEICWNLVEAYLADGKAHWAASLLDDIKRFSLENADIYNRIAKSFIDDGDKASAIEMLFRSLQHSPNQQQLYPLIDTIKEQRPRVAFFNGCSQDVKFLKDIAEFISNRFEVRIFKGNNSKELDEIMQWADICWFEWATDMLVYASRIPQRCKIVTRLHRFEAYSHWFDQIKWENVDKLILVGNSYIKKHLLKREPLLEAITDVITIPNGINLDRFKLVRRQKGKNIACVGYVNMRKNPMLLLQCMQKLHYIDSEYKLYFAGNFQQDDLEHYLRYMVREMGLENVVFFEGWRSDIDHWLKDKHYIVSGSVYESQGLGILEGMAAGLKPVIHNFPGADEIFESKYIFNIAEEFCQQILSDDYKPSEYRQFVQSRYPLSKQLKDINELFRLLEQKIEQNPPSSIRSIADTSRRITQQISSNLQQNSQVNNTCNLNTLSSEFSDQNVPSFVS